MRGVYYSACSLCYKTIGVIKQKCLLMRDCSLFRRLLLPEYTVPKQFSKVPFESLIVGKPTDPTKGTI